MKFKKKNKGNDQILSRAKLVENSKTNCIFNNEILYHFKKRVLK